MAILKIKVETVETKIREIHEVRSTRSNEFPKVPPECMISVFLIVFVLDITGIKIKVNFFFSRFKYFGSFGHDLS